MIFHGQINDIATLESEEMYEFFLQDQKLFLQCNDTRKSNKVQKQRL
jgi:hypothetical protein